MAGAPFLLKSTEIYRSPLPLADIDSLSKRLESNPFPFPFRFQVVLLGFDQEFDRIRDGNLEASFLNQIQGLNSEGLDFSVSVVFESKKSCLHAQGKGNPCSWRCSSVDLDGLYRNVTIDDDKVVDDILNGALSCSGFEGKMYTAVVINRKEGEKTRVVVGQYRHFWVSGMSEVADAIPVVSRAFMEVFVTGGIKKDKAEFMPVGADGNIVLSFNLLHSNPNDWVYDW